MIASCVIGVTVKTMNRLAWDWLIDFATGAFTVAVAAAVVWLFPVFAARGAFVLLLAAVALSAWYAGPMAGLIATILSVLVAAWMSDPLMSHPILATEADWIRLLLFVAVAAMVGFMHWRRDRAEQAMRAGELRLLTALDAARMDAWDVDLSAGRAWASQSLLRLLGRTSPSDFSHALLLEHVPPHYRDKLQALLHGTLDFELEHDLLAADGAAHQVITRGHAVIDACGQVSRWLGIVAQKEAARPAPPDTLPTQPAAAQ